jgi:WD40 repeat protein
VWLWDAAKPDVPLITYYHPHPVSAVALSPDGSQIAIGDNRGGVALARLETGARRQVNLL